MVAFFPVDVGVRTAETGRGEGSSVIERIVQRAKDATQSRMGNLMEQSWRSDFGDSSSRAENDPTWGSSGILPILATTHGTHHQ
jgi:hypothetical protein